MSRKSKWSEREMRISYYIDNKTYRQIAKEKGVSKQRVGKKMKDFGLKGIKKRPYGRRKDGSKKT